MRRNRFRRTTLLACAVLALALSTPLVQAADSARSIHLVFFPETPLALYSGGVAGLDATNPRARGERRLDLASPASRAYLAYLDARQVEHIAAIGAEIGRDLEVVFRYRAAGNGIATRLSEPEAAAIAGLPAVMRVFKDYDMPLDTDRGPVFIGADRIWDGSGTGGLPGTFGEGAVVGVIDSGVNIVHESFADDPVDGHVFENPFGSGVHVGWCDPGNPNWEPEYVCNDKLIGAWDFTDALGLEDTGPIDDDGHGSHTASTAAGNFVDYNGDGVAEISGVAPHANLITYDACYVDPNGLGLCPFSATSQSVEQAILDGVVDAINYSISGGTNPWSSGDIDSFFLSAVASGIYVAASAGNSGPGPGTTNHLGPWVSTTAASTHDRIEWANALADMSGGGSPPPDLAGLSRTAGFGPASIVYAGDYANGDPDPEQCLNPFPAGTWSGEIVVCDRGTIARVMKGQNVFLGGAGGMVLADVAGSSGPVDDAHLLPAVHVDQTSGDTVRAWLASGSGQMATLTGSTIVLDPAAGDLMADFSSRGPNNAFDVVKPDVSGPGVDVFAAVSTNYLDPTYLGVNAFWLSGTSMSSPHNAGSGALMASLHSDWTPSEIKSALMTTAVPFILKEDGVTSTDAFDVGGGRLNLRRAGAAGLVLDETEANYLAAEPAMGGDPKTLNLPSFQNRTCDGTCTWTRTVRSTLSGAMTWSASSQGPSWLALAVEPATFDLAPGATQEITVTASVLPGADLNVWSFGAVRFDPLSGTVPPARMSVAIIATGEGSGSPTIAVSGSCPGDLTVDLTGGTAGGLFTLFRGTSVGMFVLPRGRCAGTELDLSNAHLVGRAQLDASGNGSLTFSVGDAFCGNLLQAVDMATCAVSNMLTTAVPAGVGGPVVD